MQRWRMVLITLVVGVRLEGAKHPRKQCALHR